MPQKPKKPLKAKLAPKQNGGKSTPSGPEGAEKSTALQQGEPPARRGESPAGAGPRPTARGSVRLQPTPPPIAPPVVTPNPGLTRPPPPLRAEACWAEA